MSVTVQDVFAPYQYYLGGEAWPSVAHTGGDISTKPVFTEEDEQGMAPQNAAAALAKLVRWAVHQPEGEGAAIYDHSAREEWARHTVLGEALAARALNLRSRAEFDALYRWRHQPVEGQIFKAEDEGIEVDQTSLVADVAIYTHGRNAGDKHDMKTHITWAARTVEALSALGFKTVWTGK